MEKIKIMCDSASDIDSDVAKSLNITLVPTLLIHDDKTYIEGIEITKEEFLDLLETSKSIPTTAAVTPLSLFDAFKDAYLNGFTHVVVVTINASGSSMYQNCFIAQNLFESEFGKVLTFEFIDSRIYTYAYGELVLNAARMINENACFSDIVSYLKNKLSQVEVIACVYSLEFAKRSGRVSGTSALVGELLGIRPILHAINGKVSIIDKVKGEKNIVPKIIGEVKNRAVKIENQDIVIIHGRVKDSELSKLTELVKSELSPKSIKYGLLGPSLIINGGPETLGIVFLGEKREQY